MDARLSRPHGCTGYFFCEYSNSQGLLKTASTITLPKPTQVCLQTNSRGSPDVGYKWEQTFNQIYEVTPELAAKTALACFRLLPVEIYADALQEEIPEAEAFAETLREWAKCLNKAV